MLKIRDLEKNDILAVKLFSDKVIGQDYFSLEEIKDIYHRSLQNDQMCSQVLCEDSKIVGIRLTFPPGNWESGKGRGLTPKSWPYKKEQTAYFQSLFIEESHVGKGYGKKLSLCSIEKLQKIGAKGIVCHSWKDSPGNSSFHYLNALGFKKIIDHPKYWIDLDYICPLCHKPCLCTAQEMYLDISKL